VGQGCHPIRCSQASSLDDRFAAKEGNYKENNRKGSQKLTTIRNNSFLI